MDPDRLLAFHDAPGTEFPLLYLALALIAYTCT